MVSLRAKILIAGFMAFASLGAIIWHTAWTRENRSVCAEELVETCAPYDGLTAMFRCAPYKIAEFSNHCQDLIRDQFRLNYLILKVRNSVPDAVQCWCGNEDVCRRHKDRSVDELNQFLKERDWDNIAYFGGPVPALRQVFSEVRPKYCDL